MGDAANRDVLALGFVCAMVAKGRGCGSLLLTCMEETDQAESLRIAGQAVVAKTPCSVEGCRKLRLGAGAWSGTGFSRSDSLNMPIIPGHLADLALRGLLRWGRSTGANA